MQPALLILSLFFVLAGPRSGESTSINAYGSVANLDGNTIKGRVLTVDRKPAANVLVFVIEGEEESLTNAKGEFEIRTLKSFPFDITAQELIGKRKRAKATAYSENVTIEFR